ncbi:hypothetical protein [Moritella sp. F3]|uniref:hypothetical protein n=1 Tax=Moritella sp. F3 TaxID=2718882 RepID=UPI0018E16738|nr:hypothetical protein [Moritella sp. F3]GIC77092.1 hypothetical protein FMO001_18190 [Moritella sp. F1]GIC82211.1 hypothetical protein FMO003_24920 [Moritella sp. F3]
MSTLEIKIDGFPSGATRTNEENQELARKVSEAISSALGVELSVHDADSYEDGNGHKINVDLSLTALNYEVKVKFGTGDFEREFSFSGWDINSADAFDVIANSGCYNDTGGGWRDTYRRLFSPMAAEYLRDPKYMEQRAEYPHFSFEPVFKDKQPEKR